MIVRFHHALASATQGTSANKHKALVKFSGQNIFEIVLWVVLSLVSSPIKIVNPIVKNLGTLSLSVHNLLRLSFYIRTE